MKIYKFLEVVKKLYKLRITHAMIGIPLQKKKIPRGIVLEILKQAGLDKKEVHDL